VSVWAEAVNAHLVEWTQATSWIDHGTPPGSIVDSEPVVAFQNLASGALGRNVYLRSADGHLRELRQVSGDGVNPGTENWVDIGIPAAASPGGFMRPGKGVISGVENAPSVIINPSQSGMGDAAQVFVTTSSGELERWDEDSSSWMDLGTIGTNGNDSCFVQAAALAGGPKAISWFGDNGVLNVNVFMTTALGDLLSWRDPQWEEPLGYYSEHGLFPPGATGRTGDLPGDFQRVTNTIFCPNQAAVGTHPDAWPPLTGVPDALAFRDGGQLKRLVYAHSGEGDIMQYFWAGDTGPVLMGPSKMYDIDSLARYRPRADVVRRTLPKTATKAFLASDPALVQGQGGDLHLVALGANDQINIFTGTTSASPPTWTVVEDDLAASETRLFAGSPGAFVGSNGLALFGIRWSGFLSTGTDTAGGAFAPTDLPPASPPSVRDNREAANSIPGSPSRGCKQGGTIGEQIFPQWRPAELQRGLTTDQFNAIYTTPPNFDQGYESEKLASVQGTVLGSHISGIDNPFNHVYGASNEIPRVHHDWNILVALDVASQSMLSDANIEDGGLMEEEWTQQDDMLSFDSIPAIGDTIALRGRYIYDCGHPPFRTEIHSPDAIALMHGSRGELRFSKHGGPVWYQPSDTNLIHTQLCTDASTLAALTDSVGVKDALWASGTCVRHLGSNFEKIQPANMCYRDYEHSLTDVIGDDIPLEFDVPLPPTGSGTPSLSSPAGGPDFTTAFPGSTATFVSTPKPHFHVVLPSTSFPAEGSSTGKTTAFEATWSSGATQLRSFEVEVKLVHGTRHDNMSTGDVTAFAIEAASFLGIISDVSCEDDDDDEMVVYATVNDKAVLINPKTNSSGTVRVTLGPDDTLTIGTHGFECDLSCGERWDDDFAASPDDRIGRAKLAFTAHENFGANPAIGTPALYDRVRSMPDLTTARSRQLSALDYSISVSITETTSVQGCTDVQPDVLFPGPGAIDTVTTVGANYGHPPGCPSQYVAEMDLTQPMFAGHDVFVAGVWTPTVPGKPCDESATMHVFGFDGTTWSPFDDVVFTGVANGNICRPHATSHTEPGSQGLDGTKVPANAFEKVRVVVAASENSVPLPVFVSAENL
jgi:hypothetical protein